MSYTGDPVNVHVRSRSRMKRQLNNCFIINKKYVFVRDYNFPGCIPVSNRQKRALMLGTLQFKAFVSVFYFPALFVLQRKNALGPMHVEVHLDDQATAIQRRRRFACVWAPLMNCYFNYTGLSRGVEYSCHLSITPLSFLLR